MSEFEDGTDFLDKHLVDPEITELDLTRTRQKEISGFERFNKLEVLHMRWNLITKIENLSTLAGTLIELELYDNQIRKIENLDELVNLRILDLSYNRIAKIEGLDKLVNLEMLYLTHNRISKIEGLENLTKLEFLELGDNRITKIENLSANTELIHLYLGANMIEKMENVEELVNLTTLCLPANDISVIEGIDTLTKLKQLTLSQNVNIVEIGNSLEMNTNLEILGLDACSLKHMTGLSHLRKLTDVYLNGNQLEDWSEVQELSDLPALQYVYLKDNPFSQGVNYRTRAMKALPQVKEIDGDLCRP